METLKQVDTFADKEKLGRRGVTSLTELGALHKWLLARIKWPLHSGIGTRHSLSFRDYGERLGNGMLPAHGNLHGGTLQLLEHLSLPRGCPP